ncbi:hypothetical protein RclHR1_15940003 [Rhizophagus clarus]|uniref:hAT-like transposase RNase-H fold domain-containing protein n=1 Tax=Rhizophagus clarus TaxID=94130 RepID=A0A2Z6QVJ2_9GLOM|nr:hypothetical protein RclHR1_15940003 [Rhizophagus clarus]
MPSKFTQTNFHKFLTKWIIADDQPFTTVENMHFQNMVKVLNSDALVPKADTIKNDIIETITVYWITKDWKLCDSLLDFIKLSSLHSGENICNAFVKSCDDFRILEKIFVITSDNTTNNDTFMKYLENTCQDKNISFNTQIKASEAETEDIILEISINTGEVIPKKRFIRHVEAAGLKELQPILDVKTRWNSTHNMLKRALKMREVLDTIARSDKELQNFELSEDEWNRIDEVMSVLMIFVHTTNVMSIVKYPMLSSVVPLYNYLIDELEDYCESQNNSSDIVIAVKAGIEKLERYYAKIDNMTIYTVATVLDPRLKLGYYEDHKWKQNFIHFVKKTVMNIYNTKYRPPEYLEDGNSNSENNGFLNHIFGKLQKIQQNEVDLYLKAP